MMFCLRTKYSLCLDRYSIFGRPSEIELLVLIDALVVTCPYSLIIGRQVDANNEKVKVEWSENNGEDVVYLVTTERT
jgi:pyrimidine operon attenuation protein/uracil phosphoribosyltransferase